jgi:hypothetical protein
VIGVRQSFVMVRPLWRVDGEMASHFDVVARDSSAMAKHQWLRRTLGLGLLAGAAYAVWRAIEANRVDHDQAWEPQPFPFPPQPRTGDRMQDDRSPGQVGGGAESARSTVRASEAPPASWTEPTDSACPVSHPVKAKLSSRIFHVPGGQSYDRTVPDRCYVDAAAAEAEGFRAAKR